MDNLCRGVKSIFAYKHWYIKDWVYDKMSVRFFFVVNFSTPCKQGPVISVPFTNFSAYTQSNDYHSDRVGAQRKIAKCARSPFP